MTQQITYSWREANQIADCPYRCYSEIHDAWSVETPHSGNRETIAVETADAMIRTLAEIRKLPVTLDPMVAFNEWHARNITQEG